MDIDVWSSLALLGTGWPRGALALAWMGMEGVLLYKIVRDSRLARQAGINGELATAFECIRRESRTRGLMAMVLIASAVVHDAVHDHWTLLLVVLVGVWLSAKTYRDRRTLELMTHQRIAKAQG